MTVNGLSQLTITALYESYASASDTWTASGVVTARLGGGAAMVVRAYVVCTAPPAP